jgi:hypothetical protein
VDKKIIRGIIGKKLVQIRVIRGQKNLRKQWKPESRAQIRDICTLRNVLPPAGCLTY